MGHPHWRQWGMRWKLKWWPCSLLTLTLDSSPEEFRTCSFCCIFTLPDRFCECLVYTTCEEGCLKRKEILLHSYIFPLIKRPLPSYSSPAVLPFQHFTTYFWFWIPLQCFGFSSLCHQDFPSSALNQGLKHFLLPQNRYTRGCCGGMTIPSGKYTLLGVPHTH